MNAITNFEDGKWIPISLYAGFSITLILSRNQHICSLHFGNTVILDWAWLCFLLGFFNVLCLFFCWNVNKGVNLYQTVELNIL